LSDGALAMVLRRDRLLVGGALAIIAALAWAYVLWLAYAPGAMPMAAMSGMDMGGMDMPGMDMAMMAPAFTPWTAGHALFMFTMWAVMMVGMMTPTAAPMILIYTGVARQAQRTAFAAAGWFAAGYLLSWTLFAALATSAQYGLERLALLSPAMVSSSKDLGAGVLFAAGLYQFTPFKNACLSYCRAPLAFIQRQGGFRPGIAASLRLGWRHGLYCIGCCWALMALLFVGGVMNILWIAAIMVYVLAEKLIPNGRAVSAVAGLAAIGYAVWTLLY
jgi:predicted metal-binding membrane protein